MGYRELRAALKGSLLIDGEGYDVDYFGMDDGHSADPTDAFRFIFQLGQGFMIHLYVIQAASVGRPRHFYHTFWLKDCAVAYVDEEDRGPPGRVESPPLDLPLLYKTVTLRSSLAAAERTFTLVAQTFEARYEAGREEHLSMEFTLLDPNTGEARLVWTRADGFCLYEPHAHPRPLGADDRLLFNPPGE